MFINHTGISRKSLRLREEDRFVEVDVEVDTPISVRLHCLSEADHVPKDPKLLGMNITEIHVFPSFRFAVG